MLSIQSVISWLLTHTRGLKHLERARVSITKGPTAARHLAYQTARSAAYLRDADALSGVPVAVIAAWIGHKDATLTMKLYTHSQSEALKAAGATLDRVVTTL